MKNERATGLKKNIPNAVSLLRILGALSLPFLMWSSWGVTITFPSLVELTSVPLVWIIVFLILAISDKVDGTIARKINAESELGAILDVIGDILLLVIGVACVLFNFARESFSPFEFWFCIFLVLWIIAGKLSVFFVAKKFFGKGNALHSIPHKAFAVGGYIAVSCWAFIHAVPLWSILLLWAVMNYAVVDEIIYVSRAAEYDVDFKGHGFEKYPLRKKS